MFLQTPTGKGSPTVEPHKTTISDCLRDWLLHTATCKVYGSCITSTKTWDSLTCLPTLSKSTCWQPCIARISAGIQWSPLHAGALYEPYHEFIPSMNLHQGTHRTPNPKSVNFVFFLLMFVVAVVGDLEDPIRDCDLSDVTLNKKYTIHLLNSSTQKVS